MLARVLLTLAIATSVVHAQPGADAPPPQEPPPAVDVKVDASVQVNAEGLIDQLAVNAPLIERVAKGTLKRARRAVSVGPTVGAFAGYFPGAEESDYALSFGIGVEVFKIPILPTPETIKTIAKDRAKARLKEKLATGGAFDAQALAREIWDDVVKEVLGMENIAGKTMEKPRFTVGLEANRLLDSEVWMTRFRAGLGISKLTLAASSAVAFTDPKTSVYAGLELVAHFLTSKKPRASVVDVFFRADFELRNDADLNFYVLGVRYLLDAL